MQHTACQCCVLPALQCLVLCACAFVVDVNRILLFIWGVSWTPTSRLKARMVRGQLKAQSDIDLSSNRYHHLRCRILWIPTIVPHLPTIAPHRLTGLLLPIIRPHPTISLHRTPLLRACQPVRSPRVRLLTQPPSDLMDRRYITHSSASLILLYVLHFGSHFTPIEPSLQGNLITGQDVIVFTYPAILHVVIRPQMAL